MGNCMSSTTTEKPKTSKTTTTKRTKPNNASTSTKTSTNKLTKENINPVQKVKKKSDGKVLGTSSSENEKIEDPREAARRAAEKRYQDQISNQGKLGSKLQEERAKSARNHLKEASEKKLEEKNEKNLVFD